MKRATGVNLWSYSETVEAGGVGSDTAKNSNLISMVSNYVDLYSKKRSRARARVVVGGSMTGDLVADTCAYL